jgi:hypothetical protein
MKAVKTTIDNFNISDTLYGKEESREQRSLPRHQQLSLIGNSFRLFTGHHSIGQFKGKAPESLSIIKKVIRDKSFKYYKFILFSKVKIQ